MKIKNYIEMLKKYDPEHEIVNMLWGQDDVIDHAETLGIILTNDQVVEVLNSLEKDHDCEIGINWDVIATTIYEIKEG